MDSKYYIYSTEYGDLKTIQRCGIVARYYPETKKYKIIKDRFLNKYAVILTAEQFNETYKDI